jgi:eukaryotic-like serine/threonine-protein kinase
MLANRCVVDFTVENLCGFLYRSKLLAPDNVKTAYQRWLSEAGNSANVPAAFSRWLVSQQYLTEYQANLLAKGQVDNFFLNDYKVLERIGRGRMAGVYKAVHSLGQVVAIKVLPPSRAKNPQLLARFQREARLSVRLRHPHCVRCFQVGHTRDLHYLVMEYLEGETLEEVLLRRKRFGVDEAVRLVHQALLGLQHLHEQGLVHRDLKPSNLMLVPAPGRGPHDTTAPSRIKILDIGLARELYDEDTPPEKAEQLTADGVLLGTPDYMAPEQARDARNRDVRADIYSLGCVLYHLIAGQVPFPDTNLLRQLMRHAKETPKPLTEFNKEVPEGLQQIIAWMMAKKPEQRYATPVRAAQALEAFLLAGNEPVATEEAPQLRSYLTWLETEDVEDEPVRSSVPVAEATAALATPVVHVAKSTPAPVAAPMAAPQPVTAAAPAVAPPVAMPVPPAPAEALPEAAPVARSAATITGRKAGQKKERGDRDTKETKEIKTLAEAAAAAPPAEEEAIEPTTPLARVKQLSRRDWILLGGGVAAGVSMCVVGELVLVLGRALFSRRTPGVPAGGEEAKTEVKG